MSESVWNRKYRSTDFESYIGNDALKGQLQTLLKKDKLPHTLMFHGTAGSGKTSMSRILAKSMMCETPVDGLACGECNTCKLLDEEFIQTGNQVHGIPIYNYDIASMSTVDDMSGIVERMRRGRGERVYILDEIQESSTRAQNALLKIAEEPVEGLYIILCTTHPQKIERALKSRFTSFAVRKPTTEELVSHLSDICQLEGVNYSRSGLKLLVTKMNRVPRDTIGRAETLGALGDITRKAVEDSLGVIDVESYINYINGCLTGRVSSVSDVLQDITDRGVTINEFVIGLGDFLVDAIKAKALVNLEEYTEAELRDIRRVANNFSDRQLSEMCRLVSQYTMTTVELKEVNFYALTVEMFGIVEPKVVEHNSDKKYREVSKKVEEEHAPEESPLSEQGLISLFGGEKVVKG